MSPLEAKPRGHEAVISIQEQAFVEHLLYAGPRAAGGVRTLGLVEETNSGPRVRSGDREVCSNRGSEDWSTRTSDNWSVPHRTFELEAPTENCQYFPTWALQNIDKESTKQFFVKHDWENLS